KDVLLQVARVYQCLQRGWLVLIRYLSAKIVKHVIDKKGMIFINLVVQACPRHRRVVRVDRGGLPAPALGSHLSSVPVIYILSVFHYRSQPIVLNTDRIDYLPIQERVTCVDF